MIHTNDYFLLPKKYFLVRNAHIIKILLEENEKTEGTCIFGLYNVRQILLKHDKSAINYFRKSKKDIGYIEKISKVERLGMAIQILKELKKYILEVDKPYIQKKYPYSKETIEDIKAIYYCTQDIQQKKEKIERQRVKELRKRVVFHEKGLRF